MVLQAAQRQNAINGFSNSNNVNNFNNDDFDYDSSVESQYSPPSGYLSPGGTSHFIRKCKLMRYL